MIESLLVNVFAISIIIFFIACSISWVALFLLGMFYLLIWPFLTIGQYLGIVSLSLAAFLNKIDQCKSYRIVRKPALAFIFSSVRIELMDKYIYVGDRHAWHYEINLETDEAFNIFRGGRRKTRWQKGSVREIIAFVFSHIQAKAGVFM